MESKDTIKIDRRKTRGIDSFFRKYANAEKKPEWQFKQFFLNKIEDIFPANRYNAMLNLLRKVSRWEEEYGKPVYNFSLEELKTMLEQFNSTSEMSLMAQKSNLEYYLLFAREQNVTSGILPATIDLSMDEIKEYINDIGAEQKYITRDEFYDLVTGNITNPIDKAMSLLIFEGIMGKANQDLINLKWRNIDFQNCIIESSGKLIQIDSELADILEEANNTNAYLLNNGNTIKKERKDKKDNSIKDERVDTEGKSEANRDTLYIVDKFESDYFFRPFTSPTKTEQEQLRGSVIQTRVLKCMKMWCDRPYLTLSSIYISGLVDRVIRYSIEIGIDEPMKYKDFVEYLKANDERVNLQQTYLLYKDMFAKELERLSKEQQEG